MLTLRACPVPTADPRRGSPDLRDVALPVRPPEPAAEPASAAAAEPAAGVLRSADRAWLTGLGVDVDRRLRRAGVTGAAGSIHTVEPEAAAPERVRLVGLGDGTVDDLRRAGAALGRLQRGREVAVDCVSDVPAAGVRAFVEGLLLASYAPQRVGRRGRPAAPGRADIAVPADRAAAVRAGQATADAVALARDLATVPSNVKSPAWLAARARRTARDAGLRVQVWEAAHLRAEGFGGLLAVGSGSSRGPRLVRLDHAPRGARRHVALVGKGITFDSGGLSLKPAESMTAMKTDMSGAAAVLAVMSALAALDVPVAVTAVLALAENMPGAGAMRPGDVIEHYGGRTTEVLNTDAEGRLVLADALAYVDRRVRADVVVDIATLTGAATLGLGRGHAGLMTPDDTLARALLDAGRSAGEPAWRLPLVADYAAALHSDVADQANVARDPAVGGGAIVAAWFLRPFAGDRPWAHLDIAGPARATADRDEIVKGPTGVGTRLLLRWLEAGAPA